MRVSEVHAAESVAYLNRALARLQDIWDEIGIPEEQRLQRTYEVHKHIKDLLDLMIVEEDELKKRLLKSVESCVKELHFLCDELQMDPFEEEEGCTLLQREKNSRTRLDVMKEHKKKRMDELKSFIARDHELCRIICTTPFSIDQDSVPSLQQLKTYQAYLDNLTKEKECRHHEFVSIKKDIIICMGDLEQEPETSFEMDVMCEDEEAFCLSDDNIAALKQLLSQLQQCKIENELCCLDLRAKIKALWERLHIPQAEREALSDHMVESKKRNMEALQTELQRLEVLKLNTIKSLTKTIRTEIELYWEKCFYSLEQREAFAPYHSDDFTVELLNLHEAELKTLDKYYEDHSELFDGVRKWQDNWTLYLELDKKNNDPSRFNNRGGNLLKEEKQRTDLQKSLPKLEKCLKAQIDIWEQECGTVFQVNGQQFLEYVQQQWDQHHNEKEKEKLERQMKKTKQTQEEMLYGTAKQAPPKRRLAETPTPGKIRKFHTTSALTTPTSILNSGLGGTSYQSTLQKPPLSASKGLGLRTPGSAKTPHALNRNKENISHLNRNTPRSTLRPLHLQDHTFNLNSYSEFEKNLCDGNIKSRQLNSTSTFQ